MNETEEKHKQDLDSFDITVSVISDVVESIGDGIGCAAECAGNVVCEVLSSL